MNSIKIYDRYIGEGQPTYVIAEMSANHGGSIERALEIVHLAKDAGADCIKTQTYTPDTMTIDSNKKWFKINKGTWQGKYLYSLYQEAYTPWEWQEILKKEAERIGLHFLSTPYDKRSVDFLEEIGVKFYKIASFEVIDHPLIKYIASKEKPIIMSTGMASLGEIEDAVRIIKSKGNKDLCLLKCTSAYPAIPDEMNLKTIKHLKETFQVITGISDHTLTSTTAVVAVALGAKIIEKHICFSREIESPDSSFSMEPNDFKNMVKDIRIAEKAIGEISYDISSREKENYVFRRSVFAVKDIKKDETFSEDNIRVIRPGYGLSPKHYEEILGKKANQNIEEGTPLNWSMIRID